MVISDGDKFSCNEDKGRRDRYRDKLDLQLYGYEECCQMSTCIIADLSLVVEITPIGIQTLHWKFYIVWTILNASFVPLMYL